MPGPPVDPLEGTPYRCTGRLGRGSMGAVYEAVHRRLQKRVCVKVLHLELGGRADLVDRMRIEAQSLAALEPPHPNLVQVLDFGETSRGQPYLAMERLYGRTLGEERTARGGWLPVAEAIDYACQALAGLEVAHAHGVVHRDVKPGNLFLCDAASPGAPRTLKVLDFGVAKLMRTAVGKSVLAPLVQPTQEGVAIGTPRFFSPEQALGLPVDHRADIYAVGLVLYALVAGRGPFDHRHDLLDISTSHAAEQALPPSRFAPQEIPQALDAAILRALSKDRSKRFATARLFAEELRRIAAAPPPRWPSTELIPTGPRAEPQAAPATSTTAVRRRSRADDAVFLLVAVLSMLVFLIVGTLLLRR